eukprot:gene23851-23906_t
MTLASNIGRFAFGSLKSAPRVLGAPNWIVPGAEMETTYFPQSHDIIEIVTTPVIMPQLGNEIEEAQIDSWAKSAGDRVERGEMLLTITTPKLTMELEAPASGTLSEILVPADEVASVGATLAGIAFKTGGGEGPDLVLIHGFGSDRLSWIGNTPALMQVARVHALDLPGHGDSLDVDCGDASPAALAVQVSRVLAENSIAPKHPERVASLTLIAAAGLGTGIDHAFLTRFPGLSEIDETTGLLHRLVVRPQLINRLTVQRVIEQLARPGARDALSRIAAGIIATEAQLSETAQQIALSD